MRYFIYLSYDGSNYHGWQVQPNGDSIQARLSGALSLLLGTSTEVIGAGRTDAGVHARLMVAHFDCLPDARMADAAQIAHKLNRMLPPDIAIHHIRAVCPDAHARFSAIQRTYQYHLSTRKDPFLRHYTYRFPQPLDFDLMNTAAERLKQYTDFTSFSKLHTDVKTNICHVSHARWEPAGGGEWVFTISADRFLRNMVRAVVGTLLDVGRGAISVDQFCAIIERKDRCAAGTSVPGNALFLTDIRYPEHIFSTAD